MSKVMLKVNVYQLCQQVCIKHEALNVTVQPPRCSRRKDFRYYHNWDSVQTLRIDIDPERFDSAEMVFTFLFTFRISQAVHTKFSFVLVIFKL